MDIDQNSSAWTTTAACLAVVLFLYLVRPRSSSWGHPPLPPGPPGEFLLGHLRVIPKERTAETYAEWAKKYKSDVIYVKSLGQPIIVLNSVDAARDLLDRRGANYCDRPRFTLFEVMGWGKTLTFLPFGPRWQMHRKLLQTTFSNTNVRQWYQLQVTEARKSVHSIIKDPDNWEVSMKRFAVAIVLKVSYGVDVRDDNDPYVKIADDAMYATGNGGAPANSIVDVFPPARHLPNWLARDWSLKFAREWGWAIQKLHNVPFAVAQDEVARGKENPSFAHTLLETYNSNAKNGLDNEWSLDDIKGAAGAIFIAGADTTWATIVVFVLNMVLHPEIQQKAQALIDRVVGQERLPTLSDRPSLQYIDHIVQEVYRWSPLAPLGIPHKSLENDVYNGMFIPKGSIIFANSRAMTQDERIYRDPKSFNPDRYKPPSAGGHGEPLPLGQFGFGRRVCVGRFLADNSVWIAAATMLATLNIGKKVGRDGQVIEPEVVFTNGGTW
ncbi:Cytochrome P450 monooxygenase COX2 [Colletotrichum fructicola]|uniref:Cytochrome p450 monooxygenase n=1 Tax=Colletotrichum fructicola (strain Nara gc5) TaxID=1213859 RepID=L2GHQ7_COLFN|nr:Cytochrome P450 monooxygenase COX2 [Colletotrichum aenigma]KAF4901314.1 Cytochrome P450 monooxygenase COX2 [Colletotrichum fructicola]KAF4916174.1 Cytochrome P450 monooxygenase COX2 [Colletotrichum fructicola]KAF4941725.1 Cytochrome P450 monooxygenase COX2 [Colletotrichum fructicola]KAF5523383.1 Cytochrome P450 monooxygenase COX2 [Colletotrichum aenigma]